MVERYFAVTAGDERTDGLALISDFGTATNPTPSSVVSVRFAVRRSVAFLVFA